MTIILPAGTSKEKAVRNFVTDHMQQHLFIFSDERKYRVQRHLAFWVFWWVFFGILYSYTAKVTLLPDLKRLPVAMVDSVFFLISHMFLAYSLMYFVIPKFVFKGRYIKAAGCVLLLFFFTACMSASIGTFVLPPLRYLFFSILYDFPTNSSYLMSLLAGLRGAITVGGIAAAIKLMKYWYIKEQRNRQLQQENMSAQIQLLKAQIHPHFLFNTLNNIYSYAQNTSPVAARMLTRLSDLLRFILYEGNQPLVPLARELQMVQDYIDLEKIRYGNNLELHLDLPQQTNGMYIAPLLLLPLIENCFKHGTSNILEQPWVNFQVTIRDNKLQMKLINGKIKEPINKAGHTGIGIQNVQKRLSLLYPGKHELTITDEEEVYIVHLKVELEKQPEKIIQSFPEPELNNA